MKNSKYTIKTHVKTHLLLSLLFVGTLFLHSCSSDDEPVSEPAEVLRASSLQIVSGATQIGFIDDSLPSEIEIVVNDQNGNPFAGTTVSFSVDEGSVTPELVITSASGKATVNWVLGSTIGIQTLTISALSSDGAVLAGSPVIVNAEALDSCQTFTSIEQLPIGPEAGTVTNSIINVPSNFIIAPGILLEFNAEHTFDADLDVFLISPEGIMIELTTDNGEGGDNYTNTIFDDTAPILIINGTAPFTGSFRPEGLLSQLNGSQAQGDWTLQITDDLGGDAGMLLNWSVKLCRQ